MNIDEKVKLLKDSLIVLNSNVTEAYVDIEEVGPGEYALSITDNDDEDLLEVRGSSIEIVIEQALSQILPKVEERLKGNADVHKRLQAYLHPPKQLELAKAPEKKK